MHNLISKFLCLTKKDYLMAILKKKFIMYLNVLQYTKYLFLVGTSATVQIERFKLLFHLQCSLVKPPPSVQSVVWRYNEFGDKLRDIENRKLCDHMKKLTFNSTNIVTCILHLCKYININNACLINK